MSRAYVTAFGRWSLGVGVVGGALLADVTNSTGAVVGLGVGIAFVALIIGAWCEHAAESEGEVK